MNRKDTEKLGENLLVARRKVKLTQAEVAKKADTKTNYYAKLERGDAIPSLKMLYKLTKVLNVSSKDILPF